MLNEDLKFINYFWKVHESYTQLKFSSTFHLQIDQQTKVINHTFGNLLRCLMGWKTTYLDFLFFHLPNLPIIILQISPLVVVHLKPCMSLMLINLLTSFFTYYFLFIYVKFYIAYSRDSFWYLGVKHYKILHVGLNLDVTNQLFSYSTKLVATQFHVFCYPF